MLSCLDSYRTRTTVLPYRNYLPSPREAAVLVTCFAECGGVPVVEHFCCCPCPCYCYCCSRSTAAAAAAVLLPPRAATATATRRRRGRGRGTDHRHWFLLLVFSQISLQFRNKWLHCPNKYKYLSMKTENNNPTYVVQLSLTANHSPPQIFLGSWLSGWNSTFEISFRV